MSNFVQVIKACEEASGAGTKKTIQAALQKADPIARRLIKETLDPFRVFGIRVREEDMPEEYLEILPTVCEPEDVYNELFEALGKFASRELTGNAARAEATRVLSIFPEKEAQYIVRIFDKDLKAGFSSTTANSVWEKQGFPERIPEFAVMLADKCEDVEDFEKNITFPCEASVKYDGTRLIAVVKKDSVVYYSRSGKLSFHVDGIFDEELQRIRELCGEDIIVDGENYASNFTETMNSKKSGNDEAKSNLRFRAFFLMPLTDWVAQKTNITMKQSRETLDHLLKKADCKKVILAEGKDVHNYQEMMDYCNEMIDNHGYEGLILKEHNSPYLWKRSLAWCKIKRMFDADCRVVGFYQGRPKSRLENTLGGLEVVGFLENGTRVEARVGSGFSDELREEIFNNRKDWMGSTVVIKYQEVSKSKSKEVASLRFPVFLNRRFDKLVEV